MNKYEKLLSIQGELKCAKLQYNSFGKYSFRSCEDILEAVKPLLAKHKATVFLTDSIKQIGDRYYVEAVAHFVDVVDGEEIAVTAYAREEESKKGMDGSQVTGASSSYARKYALNGLFDIDDTKDSDTTNNGQTPKPAAQQQPAAVNYRNEFIKLCKENGLDAVQYAAQHNINKQTTQEQYKAVCEMLKGQSSSVPADGVLSMSDIK